jgi:nucleoside-diphosphate-sugar epimerase
MKKKSIFITGGAGYIGTTLIPMLLAQNYKVTIYDSLLFNNGDTLIPFMSNEDFEFIRGDVRDKKLLHESMKGSDVVIHLAALVGFPLCKQAGEEETHSVNVDGTTAVLEGLTDDQYLLFGSTGSNYGVVTDICTEETPLNPLSSYGVTKTLAEKAVMARGKSTAFRFATAFGVSPRLRLDLLVNDLTYKLMTDGYVVIYEAHFLRTFIHVKDIARSFMFAIENQDKMADEVYNVGSNNLNHSKRDVCELIKSKVPNSLIHYAEIGEDADKRNYKVSYDKIQSLGFETTLLLENGVNELTKTIKALSIVSDYHNVYNRVQNI